MESGYLRTNINISINEGGNRYMFLVIIAYVIILYVYSVCPFLIQLVGFGLNAMAPDPIPFLDEFIMILCMISKLEKLARILEFKDDHPVWFWIIFILVVAVIVFLIIYIYNRMG